MKRYAMSNRTTVADRATFRPVRCVLSIIALLAAGCAANPEPEPLPDDLLGERARVVSDPADLTEPPVGILSLLTADSVVLKTDDGVWRPVRLGPARRLEISRGTDSKAGRGAVIGAIAGGVGLAIIGAVSCADDSNDTWFYVSPAQCAAGGAFLGGGAGALIGMVIGSFSKTEHWVEAPAPAGR